MADLAVTTVAPFKVVDLVSGFEVPSQAVTVGGLPRVRILATNVPSVGYRVYEVRPGAGASYSDAAIVTGGTLDNGIYRITLGSRGQITSFVDHKDADRQLVGGSGAIHDFLSGSGAVTVEAQGPVSTTLKVVASGLPDHETRVTLHRGLDRVDVDGRVTENFGDLETYESTFALPGMTMRHEEVGMIATVARLSQGGDYAEANTRTDYLTFNHFVDLSQAARGVTISSPDCGFFRAGNSTITSLDGSTPKITAVVGMQVDGPGLGIANQGGDSFFLDRFGFRTHTAYDPAAAMRFALEHQSPLVATRVSGTGSAPLQPTTWSLLGIDNPDVILWALKPAEEGIGNGVIARVWNLSESPRTMNLSWLGPPTAVVRRVTHIETDLSSATFGAGVLTAALTRQQLQSFRLQIATPTAVTPAVPAVDFALSAYPNPTTGAAGATLRFRLSSASLTRVSVFDVRGREIARPHDGLLSAGEHTVRWDARGRAGERIPAGVYLVRVDAGSRSDTKRLVIW